jgi:hypothetical protein
MVLILIFGCLPLNMELVLNVNGSLFGTIILFVFPILAYNKHFTETISKPKLVFNYLLMIIGVTGGLISTILKIK